MHGISNAYISWCISLYHPLLAYPSPWSIDCEMNCVFIGPHCMMGYAGPKRIDQLCPPNRLLEGCIPRSGFIGHTCASCLYHVVGVWLQTELI